MHTTASSTAFARRLACLALLAAVPAFGAQGAEPAVWKDQELVLDYMGFTTHYSCDGLRDRIRTLLLKLGARPDLSVTSSGCTNVSGGPERFPQVEAHFATLQPVAAPSPGSGNWKTLELGGHDGLDGGECELADDVVRTVLPHFAVRNVQWHDRCVPHAANIALSLRLDVFAPIAAATP